ncbi:hypothetical protein GCM10011390_32390 [Aureimonas endophytica]|uniref:Uncharacterized protein n=1 Tax=Aureimonas endophytica TaxID=2027858 RepID=A0A916ZTI9_9HYPH|nr:hypothetical protein [Aureimonas endophytica]GGE10877.1 hypothetical protein GCM10011390_32390 [Aureimonas endophytica]
MKRPPAPFVVEHKRRPRRAKAEPASIWSGDVGRTLQDMLRPDAATPDAGGAEAATRSPTIRVEKRADSALPKRILEAQVAASVEPPPAAPDASDDEPFEKPRRGRPRKALVVAPVEAESEPEIELEAADPIEAAAPEPVATVPLPDIAAHDPAPGSGRLSYRERRQSARKDLPLGERWRWNRKY